MKAAIYTRVSTSEQALEGYSLDAQKAVLTKFAEEKGYGIYETYSDEGISGKDLVHRPSILRMIEDAKNGCFQNILIWRLSRLSRNLKDILIVCDEMKQYDVYIESYCERLDYRTATGKLMLNVHGSIAEYMRDELRENISLGLNERAQKGYYTSGKLLGYDIDKNIKNLVINVQEMKIVQFIERMYLNFCDLRKTAEACRKKDYKGKNGGIFTESAIHIILKNPTYCGFNMWHGIAVPGRHEPIRTIEQHNQIQTALEERARSVGGRPRKKGFTYL